jgi:4'-phosphopantetheinyl transferase EntD
MPLVLYRKLDDFTALGVWNVKESESWFLERLELVPEEVNALHEIQAPQRRKEWLGARWLLHYLTASEKRQPCLKDAFGKPYLLDGSREISISHSVGFAAVLISKEAGGIDIQRRVEKIRRIKHKFVNEAEDRWIRTEHNLSDLHLIWGAKEALYKTYSKKKVDFCRELEIKKPDFKDRSTRGIIYKNKESIYDIHYDWVEDYLLVYALFRAD